MKTGIDHDAKTIKLDNYTLSTFRECPQKYAYRIKEGLIAQPEGYGFTEEKSLPMPVELSFGIAIHKALDTLFNEQNLDLAIARFLEVFADPPEDKKRTPGRGVEVIEGYWDRWYEADRKYDRVQSELSFIAPLGAINDYEVYYGGLIDKVLRSEDNEIILMDHKTSSWESQYLVPAYALSNQFRGYIWGFNTISPTESADHLLVDILLLKPKNNDYFRSDIKADPSMIDEWKAGILQTAQMMLLCDQTDIWPLYGKEPCTNWNRVCTYFQLCDTEPSRRNAARNMLYTIDHWDTDKR